MMILNEDEMKYNAMALLDDETGYDNAMENPFYWDWDRNSSHTGLIEAPSTGDNSTHLRDKVRRARGDDYDIKRLNYLLRILNPTTLFHRTYVHKITRELYNGIVRLGLQQKEKQSLVALLRLPRQTSQAVR